MNHTTKQYWSHNTAEIQKGTIIGSGTKIWQHAQILKGAEIGENCVIGHNCFISGRAKIGTGVKIGSNVDVFDLVTLEDYVFISPSVVFTNDLNPRAKYPKNQYPENGKWLSTLVKDGATIGSNATILCGNTIGKWALIGAGSVVTKDVSDYALLVGVPAKQIGWVCECASRIEFENGKAECKICKRKYQQEEERVWQL